MGERWWQKRDPAALFGGANNQIKYAALAASVTLAANTEYYVVSQETASGDVFYDRNTMVTVRGAATSLKAVYSLNGGWVDAGSAGNSYGPVDLQYCSGVTLPVVTVAATDGLAGEPGSGQGTGTFTLSRTGSTAAGLSVNYTVSGTATSGSDYTGLGTSVNFGAGAATAVVPVNVLDDTIVEGDETVALTLVSGSGYVVGSLSNATVTIRDDDSSGCVVTNLVSGFVRGTVRNNFTGFMGMHLRVGASAVEVQSLGRIYVSGNVQNHELQLVAANGGAVVASVIWQPSGGVNNQIKYATLAAPVILAANTEYYVVSQETASGDIFYDRNTTVTLRGAATSIEAVHGLNGSWVDAGSAGNSYGPVEPAIL